MIYADVMKVLPCPLALYYALASIDVSDVMFRVLMVFISLVVGLAVFQLRTLSSRVNELEKYQASDSEKGRGMQRDIGAVHEAISSLHGEIRDWRVEMRGEMREAADGLREELRQHVRLKISEHKDSCGQERSRGNG